MVWKGEIPIARMDRNPPETTPTERDRNAHLIAAAPDLLEVCEDMDAIMASRFFFELPKSNSIDWNKLRVTIKAAIAKAKGGYNEKI